MELKTINMVSALNNAELKAVNQPDVEVDPNLIGLYNFLNGSGIFLMDTSGKNHTGDIGVATWQPGRPGRNCLQFNNADGARVECDSLVTSNDLSIAKGSAVFWFKMDNGARWSDSNGYKLWEARKDTTDRMMLQKKNNDKMNFQMVNNGSYPACEFDSSGLSDTDWHMVVGTWELDIGTPIIKIYFDGDFKDSETNNVAQLAGQPVRNTYGADQYWSGNTQEWCGSIDEIRIYDKVLTADEVTALWNAGQ